MLDGIIMRISKETKKAMKKAVKEVRKDAKKPKKKPAAKKKINLADKTNEEKQFPSKWVDDNSGGFVFFHEGKYWVTKMKEGELRTFYITAEDWEKQKDKTEDTKGKGKGEKAQKKPKKV